MPAERFLDTNVLFSAYDLEAPEKRGVVLISRACYFPTHLTVPPLPRFSHGAVSPCWRGGAMASQRAGKMALARTRAPTQQGGYNDAPAWEDADVVAVCVAQRTGLFCHVATSVTPRPTPAQRGFDC